MTLRERFQGRYVKAAAVEMDCYPGPTSMLKTDPFRQVGWSR